MTIGTLDTNTVKKIIRLFLGAMCFLCVTTIIGLEVRAAHQFFFAMGTIVIFALMVKNIWLTLFIWWSICSFTIFKFETGALYMTNIFYGSVLFYLTKYAFEKKHISWFINMILWVVCLNLFYSILQVIKMPAIGMATGQDSLDFMYRFSETLRFTGVACTPAPIGLMANSGVTATLYCLAIPLIGTRSDKSIIISFLMLIPIFLLNSAVSIIAAGILLMYLLWFKVSKKIWFTMLVGIMLSAGAYLVYCDTPGVERLDVWRIVLQDANCHPLKGWGMDSFRKVTSLKLQTYHMESNPGNNALWDNPHNIFVSLFFEFGIIPILLLGGYFRENIIKFRQSIKEPNVIGLCGFIFGFFLVSMGNFPMWLARTAIIIIPVFALMEIQIGKHTLSELHG